MLLDHNNREERRRIVSERRRESVLASEKRLSDRPPIEVRPPSPQPVATPPSSYNLAHIGAGGNAIAAAASQAIAATQQVPHNNFKNVNLTLYSISFQKPNHCFRCNKVVVQPV